MRQKAGVLFAAIVTFLNKSLDFNQSNLLINAKSYEFLLILE